jgi:NTP pyrophosphatase (non-canonical NTP hydrolase)
MTVDELVDAVDKDEKSHLIRELAELLLAAMNDWPSFDETEIKNFVEELKEFFGSPLTVERINSKPLNLGVQHNAWRHEAGASIAEMIDRSTRINNESEFDKILDQIFNYYNSDKT